MLRSLPFRPAFLLVLSVAILLTLTSCSKDSSSQPSSSAQPAKTAPPQPPPPPPPPATSLGELVKVEKVEKAGVQAICQGDMVFQAKAGIEVFSIVSDNICNAEDKARAGKVFLVLRFEGKGKRRGDGEVTTFRSVTAGGFLARMEDRSWLEDAAGNKYKNALLVVKKDFKNVLFEVPADQSGWVWHDAKEAFKLEPHPVALAPAEPAAPAASASPAKQ